MSRLSPALKELIFAPFSRHGPTKAPAGIGKLYERIASEAHSKNLGPRPWIVISVRTYLLNSRRNKQTNLCACALTHRTLTSQAATTFTLNSPDSLAVLQTVATSSSPSSYRSLQPPVRAAELIREVGLKCISFNGIPRTINNLGAFRDALPKPVRSALETRPSRALTPQNLSQREAAGKDLWRSVYDPFDEKLLARLADSHPDLPVHILGGHYASLLSNPDESVDRGGLADVGRVLTSLVAIAALRAQTGVGPQVLSHLFGLRKAVEQGFAAREADGEDEVKGLEWLGCNEGCEWVLKSVDDIVEALGSNFASKL